MKKNTERFACCFCGVSITPCQSDTVEIAVTIPDGGTQGLWSHAKCIREHLHKSVPLAIGNENGEITPQAAGVLR